MIYNKNISLNNFNNVKDYLTNDDSLAYIFTSCGLYSFIQSYKNDMIDKFVFLILFI